MSSSDSTQEQNPGLTDPTAQKSTEFMDRTTSREQGLGSDPGITDKATDQAHQFLDKATGEGGEGKGIGEKIVEGAKRVLGMGE